MPEMVDLAPAAGQMAALLDALATAWADPAAWQGMTQAGGVSLPAEAPLIDQVVGLSGRDPAWPTSR